MAASAMSITNLLNYADHTVSSQPSPVPLNGFRIFKTLRDVPYKRDERAQTFFGSNTSVSKADVVNGRWYETFAIKEIKIEGARWDADKKRNDLQREDCYAQEMPPS
ncbi:hypothetical protein MMC18_002277 [Xylographa bjoerkii]|nr:hypothetical protein [Xylographa bjoerkii]